MKTSLIIALIFALAGVLVWYLLYSRDGVREPRYAVLDAFGFGLLAILIALPLEAILIPNGAQISAVTVQPTTIDALRLALMVAITEESAKFLPLALFIHRRRYFNRAVDGVIYFALAGLAFGVIENLLYVWRFGADIGLYRSIVLVFFHAATSGIVGFAFAKAKIEKRSLAGTLSLFILIIFEHAIYDWGLIVAQPLSIGISLLITAGLNVTLFVLYYQARHYDIEHGLIAAKAAPTQIITPTNPT